MKRRLCRWAHMSSSSGWRASPSSGQPRCPIGVWSLGDPERLPIRTIPRGIRRRRRCGFGCERLSQCYLLLMGVGISRARCEVGCKFISACLLNLSRRNERSFLFNAVVPVGCFYCGKVLACQRMEDTSTHEPPSENKLNSRVPRCRRL